MRDITMCASSVQRATSRLACSSGVLTWINTRPRPDAMLARMFRLFRAPREQQLIDAGRVFCPLRSRDVDLEACMQCGFARRVQTEGKPPFVSCRPPRGLLILP